jgi:hypothetical protein
VLYRGAIEAAASAAPTRRVPVAVGPGWQIPTPPPRPGLDTVEDAYPEITVDGRPTRIEPLPRRG